METVLYILITLVIVTVVAVIVSRSIIKSRVAVTESSFKAQEARLETELKHATERNQELEMRHAKDLEEREKNYKEDMNALQERFNETIAKVTAQMKAETGEMLKAREKAFSESSSASIGQLVTPLKENIALLKKAMEDGNKEQAERSGEMREQIRNLMEHSDAARKSADELAAAFKHSGKVQGDWGEAVLDELLSSQGLTCGIHYDTQAAITPNLRPDVILHLDNRREVIIDSKVSLTAYMNYVNAETDEDKKNSLKEHVDSIKRHWKELSAKDYSSYVKAPKVSAGYVIMFVPVSGAFWTALNADPGLWREAANHNVYITDEMSLFTVLKMVKLTWTQIAQVQNHEKVFKLADEMMDRVGMFMETYENVGKALQQAAKAYDDGNEKLTPGGQSIITTAKKLVELGAKNKGKHAIKALLDVSEVPISSQADQT